MRRSLLLSLALLRHATCLAPPTSSVGSASTAAAPPLGRRQAVATALSAATALVADRAGAYDSIPQVEPDFAAMEKLREERLAKSAKKTVELKGKVSKVQAAKDGPTFIKATDEMAVWVIGEGSRAPSRPEPALLVSAWTRLQPRSPGALPARPGDCAVPEGYKVKALVQDLKDAYDSLPKKSYACEMTRTNKGVCYTPGKDVELAFDALLKELRTYSVRDLERDRSVRPLSAGALLVTSRPRSDHRSPPPPRVAFAENPAGRLPQSGVQRLLGPAT